jgi:hypothetical protein
MAARAGRAVLLARKGSAAALGDAALVARRSSAAGLLYQAACAYSLCGKTDEALKLLWRAFRGGAAWIDISCEDADLRALHELEAFKSLIPRARDWHRQPIPSNL